MTALDEKAELDRDFTELYRTHLRALQDYTPGPYPGRVLLLRAAGQAARTAMCALVPVIELVTVSVAVMVWFPGVAKVTGNMPTPAGSVESAGRVMVPKSVLVKCAIPA